MRTHSKLLALLCAAALAGCGAEAVQDITAPKLEGARIKFFNMGVNAPGVNFYANDTKMTAVSATQCATLTNANREQCTTTGAEATTGVAYAGVGLGGYYAQIAPGQYKVTGRIAAATDKDLAISELSATLADGKAYSVYLSGVYNATTKKVDAFYVEDAFSPERDFKVAYVRHVNAIHNSKPLSVFLVNQDTTVKGEIAVGGAVAYKSAGEFVAVPNGVYNVGVREAGTNLTGINTTGVSFIAGRVYTISSRGDMTVATGTNVPGFNVTANR
jgi:hypothetical protein